MNVLSLFDGMSCGQIALKELGIIPDIYYASEIDKHAIKQTKLNFPDTMHLGDVREIDVLKLKKIDLLIGGSPCQSFSFAGKRKGMSTKCEIEITRLEQYLELKEHGFEFEGQSYLFWEYMRILTDIRKYNPDVVFLLENVEMGKKWERVLSEAIGVYGVHINSALVSAQNRKRIYWTNIRTRQDGLFGELHSDIPQPKDRGILLKDILDDDVDEKYYLSDEIIKKVCAINENSFLNINEKARTQRASTGGKSFSKKHNYQFIKLDKNLNIKSNQEKASCFTAGAHSGGNHSDMDLICVSMVGRKLDETGTRKDNDTNIKAMQRLDPAPENKTNCLTTVQKDNLVLSGTLRTYKDENGFREVKSGKTACVLAQDREDGISQNVAMVGNRIRRLTPSECAALQTVPKWYKWECSDTQQYKMLGNGWTIEVIKHIFKYLKQTTL